MTTKRNTATTAWSKLTPGEALMELERMDAERKGLDHRIKTLVLLLRTPDLDGYCPCSWSEIAAAIGVTKQAAQQRFTRAAL